jgi:hypothetical protein
MTEQATQSHFISLTVRVPHLLRYLKNAGAAKVSYSDEGSLIKTALSESFGGHQWPKPFFVRVRKPNGDYEVLAYSRSSAEKLASAYSPLPGLSDALPIDSLFGYPLREPAPGTELKFYLEMCPMIRVNRISEKGTRKQERDLFGLEVERARQEGRVPEDRMAVYNKFLVDRMKGAEVITTHPVGFRIARVDRKTRDGSHSFGVPAVSLSGILRVTNPKVFLDTVSVGIGRQRTYGMGMILLGAAAPKN